MAICALYQQHHWLALPARARGAGGMPRQKITEAIPLCIIHYAEGWFYPSLPNVKTPQMPSENQAAA